MEKTWEALQKKYPILLERIWPECGIGWYDLLDKLCSDITECVSKEAPLIYEDSGEVFPCQACQVKEKYGGLRFYMGSATEAVYKLIDEAEKKSYSVCEICGGEGKFRNDGWCTVRCNECGR